MKNKIGYLEKLRNENRIGKVNITRDRLLSMSKTEINVFFKNFIIIRAEYLFHNNTIEYIGYSSYFEIIEQSDISPVYKLSITKDNKGKIVKTEWIKCEYF